MDRQASYRAFAIIALLVTKSAKVAKLLKLAKPAVTFLSMAASAFAYAFFLGPWFAIGLVGMLFIHEMGHVFALRLKGYPATTPVFIPFLGAAIFLPNTLDRDNEAYVGYGGPLVGSIGALLLFGAWFFVEDKSSSVAHIMLITSYAAIYLNVINLIPVRPLDGGRVLQAAGKKIQYIGFVGLVVLTFFWREPFVLLLWILIIAELDSLNVKLRAFTASLCLLSMITLMALGYSSQPNIIDVVDCCLGGLFTLMLISEAVATEALVVDTRPELTADRRRYWLVLYVGLAVILGLTLALQSSLLPPEAIR